MELIDEGALTQCTNLAAFDVAEGCKAVTQKDGVLYSIDGTVLVAFPAGRIGSFTVPNGVITIGYGVSVGRIQPRTVGLNQPILVK